MNKANNYQGGFWPSKDDTLLMKAILLPRQEAIRAWEEWLKIVDIDTLEAGTQRMFPMLYVKLKEYNIDHPLMNKFKGIYRQTWYKNQMAFHQIVPLLNDFKDAKIDTLVLKGAALTVLYYKDLGLRHMSDFDFMIAPSDVKKALLILQTLGYMPIGYTWESFDDKQLYFQHGWGFMHTKSKQEVDLHWHLLRENCGLNDDDILWQHIQPMDINHFPTHTLDATNHLMHACIHGLVFNSHASIRWLADAKIIIDQNEIEWERLIKEVQNRKVIFPVLQAFNYLCDEFSVSIPAEVLSKLSALKLDKIEYYGATARQYDGRNPTYLVKLSWLRYNYLRYSQARSLNNYSYLNPLIMLDYLKGYWRLSSIKQLPGAFFQLGIRMIKRSYT